MIHSSVQSEQTDTIPIHTCSDSVWFARVKDIGVTVIQLELSESMGDLQSAVNFLFTSSEPPLYGKLKAHTYPTTLSTVRQRIVVQRGQLPRFCLLCQCPQFLPLKPPDSCNIFFWILFL